MTQQPYKTIKINFDEENSAFMLEYYILEDVLNDDGKDICVFGIEIRKIPTIQPSFPEIERITDILPSKEEVILLANLLAYNYVTPMTLSYVVYDLLSEPNILPLIFEHESKNYI